jgi:hypothetical protein
LKAGSNRTTIMYNDSIISFYNARNSLKNIFFYGTHKHLEPYLTQTFLF